MVKQQYQLPWQTNQQINRDFVGISTYMQAPSQKCIFIRNYLYFLKESLGFKIFLESTTPKDCTVY